MSSTHIRVPRVAMNVNYSIPTFKFIHMPRLCCSNDVHCLVTVCRQTDGTFLVHYVFGLAIYSWRWESVSESNQWPVLKPGSLTREPVVPCLETECTCMYGDCIPKKRSVHREVDMHLASFFSSVAISAFPDSFQVRCGSCELPVGTLIHS